VTHLLPAQEKERRLAEDVSVSVAHAGCVSDDCTEEVFTLSKLLLYYLFTKKLLNHASGYK